MLIATWRFPRQRRVWTGLSYVRLGITETPIDFAVGALNWTTGETVAVKQIQLSNIPKGDLGEIMASTPIAHIPTLIVNTSIV